MLHCLCHRGIVSSAFISSPNLCRWKSRWWVCACLYLCMHLPVCMYTCMFMYVWKMPEKVMDWWFYKFPPEEETWREIGLYLTNINLCGAFCWFQIWTNQTFANHVYCKFLNSDHSCLDPWNDFYSLVSKIAYNVKMFLQKKVCYPCWSNNT